MRIKFLIVVFFCVILFACVSKQGQNVGAEIAKIYEAKSYSVKTESNYSTSEGSHKIITLTLTGPKLDGTERSVKKISSIAALLLMQKIDSTEGFDRFKITIESDNSDHNQTFAASYLKRQYKLVEPFVKTFTKQLKKRSFNSLKPMFETRSINDSAFTRISNFAFKVDSAYGKVEDLHLTGFIEYKVKDDETETGLMTWMETKNEKGNVFYRAFLSESTRKIIGFKISTKPIE